MKRTIRESSLIFGFCLLASALLLLLCSQCSPLYPINVWGDANCLLTVGRVMHEGGVVYRDIYEQKGPTLYLIHALAAAISDESFLGVYVMEVVSMAMALWAACCLLLRRMPARAALPAAALVCALVLISGSFYRGDSAEEFCLPYLMGALAIALTEYSRESAPMRPMRLFACGLMAGVVATIKFTVLGLFVGLCMAEGILALRRGGMVRALKSAAVFLAGMALPVVCWLAYFAAHGAPGDFYTAYIHNNVFLYSDGTRTALDAARDVWHALRQNLPWMLAALAGLAAVCLNRRESGAVRLAMVCMAVCAAATVFLIGRSWQYSPLALAVFAFASPAFLPVKGVRLAAWPRAAAPAVCALALAVACWLSPNAYLRGMPMESLAQARLAQHIHEGATLLQYSHLDDGLYLASGRLPQHKYFVRLNVQYDEMYAELDRYVAEAIPDYVLTAWSPLPEKFDRYQLIATDAGYDDRDRVNKMLYLYRRK